MNELVAKIVEAVGLPQETADQAIRIVLNFLHKEGPTDIVAQLASQLGLSDMLGAAAPAAESGGGLFGGGGLMGAIGGLMGGSGGGAMAAFSQLSQAGLDMDQIQGVTKTFIDHAKEKVDPNTVDQIIGSVPGLSQFI